MQCCKQCCQLGDTRHTVVEVIQIVRCDHSRTTVVKLVFAVIKPQTERIRAVFPDKFIGVFGAVQLQDFRSDADTVEQMNRFFRRTPSRIVHIVRDDDFLCITCHDACLFGCDRRSERCHGIRHTGGMNGNDIHITFTENQPLGTGMLGVVERKQRSALFEPRSIGGVQIFGLGVIHDTSAERDNLTCDINNRKHHAITEDRIQPTVFL